MEKAQALTAIAKAGKNNGINISFGTKGTYSDLKELGLLSSTYSNNI